MYVRNHEGIIIKLKLYYNESDKYTKLWKIKYNIDLDEKRKTFSRLIIDYVNGVTNFI